MVKWPHDLDITQNTRWVRRRAHLRSAGNYRVLRIGQRKTDNLHHLSFGAKPDSTFMVTEELVWMRETLTSV